jgi:hypothetical protein
MFAAAIGQRLVSTNVRMAGPKLTLYVDTVSPFAYEAYYILRVSFVTPLWAVGCCFQREFELGWSA